MDIHLYYLSSLQSLRSSPPKVLRKLHLVTSTKGKILSAFQQPNSKMPLVTSPQIYFLSAALRPPQLLIPTSSPSTSALSVATPLRGTSHAQPSSSSPRNGPSTQELISTARSTSLTILAGLFEKETDPHFKIEKIYNTYLCVSGDGLLANRRKLHPFIARHLSAGAAYAVFEMHGWRAGVLICYDNNVVENVRATALLGADILFAPQVTMCTLSPRPGAGFVEPVLWATRERDLTSLRAEFEGLVDEVAAGTRVW